MTTQSVDKALQFCECKSLSEHASKDNAFSPFLLHFYFVNMKYILIHNCVGLLSKN